MQKGNLGINIGARALSEEQLKKILPEYIDIEKRIESIRGYAQEYNNKRNLAYDSYESFLKKELNRNNNNVFSILGDRGSGKTSALLTIKNKLTVKNNLDIMLPLIIPEDMGEGSYILGWTICSFEKIVDNIESYIYNNCNKNSSEFNFFKNCRRHEKNDLRKSFDDLLKYYTYVNKEYRDILSTNYDGINDYREKTKEVINAERELLNKFEEFIDTLLKVKKYINNTKNEPLIYIFFDDIDLNTSKCLEIVNMILKYLCNVNIVVFVSGSYQTFSEAITISLLKKDGILNNIDTYFYEENFAGGKNALQTRKTLAQDILKKVLPPAYRMYMPKLSNKQKAEFIYSTSEEDLDEKSYYTLVQLINSKLLNIEEEDKEESFLYYNDSLIDIYFSIFDDNPRGLMNVYYFLYELRKDEYIYSKKDGKSEEQEKRNKQREYCKVLKEFLNIIVDSNSNLSYLRTEIDKIINIKNKLEDIFINYKYIKEVYYDSYVDNYGNFVGMENKDDVEVGIQLFLLAHFIENMVILRMKMDNHNTDRKSHGLEILISMVNGINGDRYIPRYNNSKFVLAFYSQFNNKLNHLVEKRLYPDRFNYFTKIYLSICYELIFNKKGKNIKLSYLKKILSNILRDDYQWVERTIRIIINIHPNESMYLQKPIREFYNYIHINKISNNLKESIKECFIEVYGVFRKWNKEIIIKSLLILDTYFIYKHMNFKDESQQVSFVIDKICECLAETEGTLEALKLCVRDYINVDTQNIYIEERIKKIINLNISSRNKYEVIGRMQEILDLNEFDLNNIKSKINKRLYKINDGFIKNLKEVIKELESLTDNEEVIRVIKDTKELIEWYDYYNDTIDEDDFVFILKKIERVKNNIDVDYDEYIFIEELYDLFNQLKNGEYKLAESESFEKGEFERIISINIFIKALILYIENRIDYLDKDNYSEICSMNSTLQDILEGRRSIIQEVIKGIYSNTDNFIDGVINNV